jgi:hypothetical protein
MTTIPHGRRRTVDEILAQHGIQCRDFGANGSGYTLCPQCSHLRKPANQRKPVLCVSIKQDGVLFFCNHCQWSGGEFFEARPATANVVARYDYRCEAGELLFQTVRFFPKDFRQRRPDGKGGWIWNLQDVRRVLYRLPDLAASRSAGHKVALIVEGEKDVDRLHALGAVATCNPMGAGKWRDEYAELLCGFEQIIVIADKDDAGRAHAQAVAASVTQVVPHVKVIELPGEHVKDTSDFIAADGTLDEIYGIAEAAQDWAPAGDSAAGTLRAKMTRKPHGGNASSDGRRKDRETKSPTQADVLIELALRKAGFWHSPDSTAFTDIRVDKHRETWPVRSRNFKLWLAQQYYRSCGGAPNSDALQSALNVLEARARFDGSERHVSVRIANTGARTYIDLGTQDWSAVEIDADGWRIVAEPPVRFRRSKGMLPLPLPRSGGDIKGLRRFLNVKTDEDFALVIAFLLGALRGRGPFVIIVLTGEHGTAKSTLTRIVRALCDPNGAPLRSLPREDRDLFISANNGYVLAYDNVSSLPPWLSDSLARLATGGGFGTRELYSDNEETLFDAMRPFVLNGIDDFVTRGDLADRAMVLALAEIPDDKRRDEETFWKDFDLAAPLIFGALLDAVACGLKELSHVKLSRTPRMADFAKWVVACEGKLPWEAGTFMRAYEGNRTESVETMLESDPVAVAVRALLRERAKWEGIAAELLKALNAAVAEETKGARDWPKTPRAMSGALRRAAPGLRKVGYGIEFTKGATKQRSRLITLQAPVEVPSGPSKPSAPSEAANHAASEVDARPTQPSAQPSTGKVLNDNTLDGVDGADGRAKALEEAAPAGVSEPCSHCGRADGRIQTVTIAGEPFRLHPQCEDPFRAALDAASGPAVRQDAGNAATPSPGAAPGNGVQRAAPAPVCEQCGTSDGDLRKYQATLPDGSHRGVCAPPSPKVAPSSEPLDPLAIPPFLRRAPP